MGKYKLEPDENLMQFAARFGVKVTDIWHHEDNKRIKDKFGSPWLVGPGEYITVPEKPGTGRTTLTGKLREFKKIQDPPIVEVYLGFMDEEVNARLAKLIENEDKKSEKDKRPVILIERGRLIKDEPILEWRLGNYKIGDNATPIRKILHVSPKGIRDATKDENAPVQSVSPKPPEIPSPPPLPYIYHKPSGGFLLWESEYNAWKEKRDSEIGKIPTNQLKLSELEVFKYKDGGVEEKVSDLPPKLPDKVPDESSWGRWKDEFNFWKEKTKNISKEVAEWRKEKLKWDEQSKDYDQHSDASMESEAIAPEDLLGQIMAIYMEQEAQADRDLKGKKIVVCANCGLSKDAWENNKDKYAQCSGSVKGHDWQSQTGVEFRRAFDLLELIGHRKPGGSKSGVPVSEEQIRDGPWLSVVRFDIGPDKYEKAEDIRAPVVVIRTPEMGLQPSLMQPYIEFLFKCISVAASNLASEKAKLTIKEETEETISRRQLYDATAKEWEWPLQVFQFGAQGSCSVLAEHSPGKIITVIASLYVGAEIDRNGTVWSVISLCTPGGIYEFFRTEFPSLVELGRRVEQANKLAGDIFHQQKDEKNHKDLELKEENIHRDPNNPYKTAEGEINAGDTLKGTIDKIYNIYKEKYKGGKVPAVVTLTLSYFGGDDDKEAADKLGIYSVGMEDYHVLRILRSAFCQGISKTTDYPIVLGWRIDRVQCDPKEIDSNVKKVFDKYIKNTNVAGKEPHALLTAEEYADIIIWGLKGLITTAMPKCARWNFIDYYWKKSDDWKEKLKSQFWSFTYFGRYRDWTFLGLRKSRFMVPNPFHIEIATDLLEDLSKVDIKTNIDLTGANAAEVKRRVQEVKDAWKRDEAGRHKTSGKAKTRQEEPLRVEEKRYYGPKGSATRQAAIELMEYIGEYCRFDSGEKRKGKPLLKTWLRANKWGTHPNWVTAATTQDLEDGYNGPEFDGACVDRAFYKSCNMMALQTMAGNLWDIYVPMEVEPSENE